MIEIFAIDKKTGERIRVDDYMYFFEENYIQSINDSDEYSFEIFVDKKKVFPK